MHIIPGPLHKALRCHVLIVIAISFGFYYSAKATGVNRPQIQHSTKLTDSRILTIISVQTDTIFKSDEIEFKPEFPGGKEAFYQHLAKNFKYPKEARKNSVSGKQIVQFVVEKDGSLTDIRIVKGLGSGLEKASIAFLKNSPKWKPGVQAGQTVRALFTLPISFNIGVASSD